jgi:hypothetical protein
MTAWAALLVPPAFDAQTQARLRSLSLPWRAIWPWGAWGPGAVRVDVAHLDARVLHELLELLVGFNLDYLRVHPDAPDVYDAGVAWREEAPFQEEWLSIPWALQRGAQGEALDCEDLCCWRVGHLRFAGERAARCVPSYQGTDHQGDDLWHVQVQRADGSVEDPSALLGMGRLPSNFGGFTWNRQSPSTW